MDMQGPKVVNTVVGGRACLNFQASVVIKKIVVHGILSEISPLYEKVSGRESQQLDVSRPKSRYSVENGSHLCINNVQLDDAAKYVASASLGESIGFSGKFRTILKVKSKYCFESWSVQPILNVQIFPLVALQARFGVALGPVVLEEVQLLELGKDMELHAQTRF